ncbi:MAG: homoserine O-acetyltransferase [Actinobacteria bacterium]|nr:MAG: homoserine O-acetyltransferase [Actinomycetota bacterium]
MSEHVSTETRFFDVPGAFPLSGGGTLTGVRVAYRTWGRPSNTAILVCHALTGSADADDWWGGLFGTGRAFDPERDYIVASNVLGGCYGTTGPTDTPPGGPVPFGPDFPALTIEDMVRLQALLLDHLGVQRLSLVTGGSMGAMQALQWAATYPDRVEATAPIAIGGAQSAWALALSEAQRAAIVGDPNFRGGRYQPAFPPAAGLAAARMVAMASYRSPHEFTSRFGRERIGDDFAVQSYLRYQGQKLVDRFDANTYLTLIAAMDSFDLADRVAKIDTPALVVGISSDVLYPVSEVRALAGALPRAEFALLNAPHGHDAFLIETAPLNRMIVGFRRRLASGWTPSAANRGRGAAWA